MLGIMVESYEHVLSPPRFFLLVFNFNFSIKLRLFFYSLNGKIGLVIKVGLKVSFSHGGAYFLTRSTW